MKVEYALPRSGPTVDHDAETVFGNPLISGQLIGGVKNIADKTRVFLL